MGNGQMMEQLMSSMDKNGDGKIGVDELPLSIRRNMMSADKDKDGFISGDELLNGFLHGRGVGGSIADMKDKAKMKKLKKAAGGARKKRSQPRRSRSRRSRSRR